MRCYASVACALVVLTCGASGAVPTTAASAEWEALPIVEVDGFDRARALASLDLSGFEAFMLEPIGIAFSRDWNPARGGAFYLKISAKDREETAQQVAALAEEAIAKGLEADGGLRRVTTEGAGVLKVVIRFDEVYVALPKNRFDGFASSTDAGRMTLTADLRESTTGKLFAHLVDKREARGATRINSEQVEAELSRLFDGMASDLRSYIDSASGTRAD